MQDINEVKAYIHSFETMGAVDGPGIRFIVFMQGCSLKCKYCQNRDTWAKKSGKLYTVEEVINKINKYTNYFKASNGGVTISGGEPLLQASFLIELFKKLKEKGIHTAIDTSGIISLTDEIKELIELTDLILLDIKCINDNICQDLCGASNKKELEFAKYLSEKNKKIWIRQVLVPGYTDNEKDLIKLRKFVDKLGSVEKIEVLPYHDMGKYKWEDLGVKYELENVKSPTENQIKRVKEILKIK